MKDRNNKEMKSNKPSEYTMNSWGKYVDVNSTDKTLTREVHVKPRGCMSYRRHNKKSKLWMVAKGKINIVLNDNPIILSEFDVVVIPQHVWHTAYLEAGSEPVIIIETWFSKTGELLEDDIERKSLPEFVPLYIGYNGI